MLRLVEWKSKLLKSGAHARGVIELCKDAAEWIRPLERWSPTWHNPDRQFSSLARHLWAVYDVPFFMDKAWLRGAALPQSWFKHVGAGRNVQTAEGLPVPFTKKMAHHFWRRRRPTRSKRPFDGDKWLLSEVTNDWPTPCATVGSPRTSATTTSG